jgi:hypothetical protein
MVNDLICVNFRQGFKGQSAIFFFLLDPGRQSLFDNPTTGTFQPGGYLVNFFNYR